MLILLLHFHEKCQIRRFLKTYLNHALTSAFFCAPPNTRNKCALAPKARAREFRPLLCSYGKCAPCFATVSQKEENRTVLKTYQEHALANLFLARAPVTADIYTRASKARARKFVTLIRSYGEMCSLFCCSFAKSAKSDGF